jgi:hypothetical protein
VLEAAGQHREIKSAKFPNGRRIHHDVMLTKRTTADDIAPISRHPAYAALVLELQKLEARHAEAERGRQRQLARVRGEKVKRSVAERAADLLAGGRIDPTSPADAVTALDEELAVLRSAIGEKTRQLDALVVDLSYEVSKDAKREFDEQMRAAYAAMEALAKAFTAAAHLAHRLRQAGYRPSAVLLPDLIPEGAMRLGDPSMVGLNEGWRFRRALEERGII